jgi:colanic acid/amylovoran biosynthesis glycosyltransferase
MKLFEHGDRFLVEGTHMRDSLMALGCPDEKVGVQHLGVNLERIEFRTRQPDDDQAVCVLVAGSFREKKGIPYAIEAFGRVREMNRNLQLTIIGDSAGAPREEREKRAILRIIEKYRLRDHVRWLGYQPYPVFMQELYRHHIFLSPSVTSTDGDTEGGVPVSIIEASASGMPILSTKHCDIPEVVLNGESGYLVQERDADALAEKLELLASNPCLWRSMGQKGREHMEREYNAKTQGERLEEIYDEVLRASTWKPPGRNPR